MWVRYGLDDPEIEGSVYGMEKTIVTLCNVQSESQTHTFSCAAGSNNVVTRIKTVEV